jgi:hypothetical protein
MRTFLSGFSGAFAAAAGPGRPQRSEDRPARRPKAALVHQRKETSHGHVVARMSDSD